MDNLRKFSAEEWERVFNTISLSRFWKPFCMTLVQTRLRINEMLALNWQDIDFENGIICVNKFVDCSHFGSANQILPYENPPFLRNVILHENTAKLLNEYKTYKERKSDSYTKSTDLVFANEQGNLRSYSGLSHNFRKFIRLRGIEIPITIQDFRTYLDKQSTKSRKEIEM